LEKEFIKLWTHTINKKGNVELRIILEDKEVYIEMTEKDVRSINQWIDVKPFLMKEKRGEA
jgi:hypothetical protein